MKKKGCCHKTNNCNESLIIHFKARGLDDGEVEQ